MPVSEGDDPGDEVNDGVDVREMDIEDEGDAERLGEGVIDGLGEAEILADGDWEGEEEMLIDAVGLREIDPELLGEDVNGGVEEGVPVGV